MDKRYKIGEFAKNLGVSIGFLKHHEKYGLLKPQVAESGYRYYEFYQAMQVVQCLRLQAMGFTSKEISDILNHTSSADMGSLFEKKRDLLVGQYHLYGEMIQYLDYLSGKGGNDFLKEETKEWSIIKPEGFYYMENASQGRFTRSKEQNEAAQKWNEYMPMVETCARFECLDSKPCLESIGQWNMGLRIGKGTGERLGIFCNPAVKLVELKKCLVYHVREKRERNLGDRERALSLILEDPLEICRRHGFSMAGDIYSVQLFCSTAQDENHMQELVMIPVSE
ncbi:MAG: MerR family transcriptional regulator [Hungatella sp.]|nr:MerR family transcriptional regulator [Hungatella sp.]